MGEDFAEIWQSDRCPPTLKKMIFRTAMEEIIVRMDAEKKTLEFTIHWKGGATYSARYGASSPGDRDRHTDGGLRDHSSDGGSPWR